MSQGDITMSEMDSDNYQMEAIKRAAQEREEIVGKYAKGENNDEDTDRWEDSAFSVYKVTDRYGFLHEKELPERLSSEEEKRKETEVKRQNKWLKMMQKGSSVMGTEKMRNRVYKGIPLSFRGQAWTLMLNVADLMKEKPKTYEEMKERSLKHSSDIKQIDMDVNRTYRNHIMFRNRYSIKQQQLFFVLSAYSMYNTEVGYCQGMSQIAALLLMYMSEEEAFWALHSLLYGKKHRMHGFFIPGFPKLLRFQNHHDKILKKFVPRLKKHLDKNEIFASLYTMKWFFQCFLDRAPFPLTLRIWDIYVFDGERVLVAMSYTTLKMHKTRIKKMEMDQIVNFLQERLAQDFENDDDAVIEQLKSSMLELKRAKMDLPPPPDDDEMAKLPFGVAVKPTFAQETGIRVPVNERTNSLKKSSQKDSKSKETNGNISERREKTSEANLATVANASNRGSNPKAFKRSSSRKTRESERNDPALDSKISRRRSSNKDLRTDLSRDRGRLIEKQTPPLPASDRPTSKASNFIDKARPGKESNHFTHERGDHVVEGSEKRLSRDVVTSSNQPSNGGNSEKVKIVWKAPSSPINTQNQFSSPRQRTTQVDRIFPSNLHQKMELSSPDQRPTVSSRPVNHEQANSDSTSRLDPPRSIPAQSVASPPAFHHSRPFSIYDNVLGSMTESEPEVANVHSMQLDTSTTSGSVYHSKMEESMENLRELVASLPVSPNSSASSPSPGASRSIYSRPHQSFEMPDESNLSSLDEMARNLSRSSELLEQEQKNVEERSAFRKAVEGAGIMQLPKRPSLTGFGVALSTAPTEVPTLSAEVSKAYNHSDFERLGSTNDVHYNLYSHNRTKLSGQWKESDLSFSATPSYTLGSDVESHPIHVNLSAIYQNRNNNNGSTVPPHEQRSMPTPTSSSHDFLSPSDLSKHILERRKNSLTHFSGRDSSDDVIESDPHVLQSFEASSNPSYQSRDRFADVASDSDYLPSASNRVLIRPQVPTAVPPSYAHLASRLRKIPPELYTDVFAKARDPNWSRTRTQISASTAVPTKSSLHSGSSLV